MTEQALETLNDVRELAMQLRVDSIRCSTAAGPGHPTSSMSAVGVISDDELMTGYQRADSRLEGHPTPLLPWVDVATGSLGQGLPEGVGVALAGRMDTRKRRRSGAVNNMRRIAAECRHRLSVRVGIVARTSRAVHLR